MSSAPAAHVAPGLRKADSPAGSAGALSLDFGMHTLFWPWPAAVAAGKRLLPGTEGTLKV